MTISVENFDDLLNFHKETLNRFAEPFTAGRVVDIEIAKQKLLVVPLRHDIVDQLSKGLSNDLYHLPISSVVDCDCLRNDQSLNRFLLASYLAEIPDAENIYQDAVVSTPYREEKTQNYYVISVRRDIGPSSLMCSNGLTDDDKQALTYSQYYELKYGKRISLDQPLLESVMASKRINCLTPRYDNDDDEPPRKRRKTGDRLKVNLIPELCPVDPFPSSLFCQAVCLPSALFRLETILLAEELRRRISVEAQLTKVPEVQVNQIQTISEDSYIIREYKACSSKCNESKEKHAYMKTESKMISLSFVESPSNAHEPQSNSLRSDATEFVDLAILMSSTPRGSRNSTPSIATILRVLTTTKANAGFDLERLEMLGDSFLKQAVSIFLYFHYPNDDEGKLSRKRRQQISNKTLRKHSLKKDLEAILCNTAFGAGRRNDESDAFDRCRRLWLPPFYCLKKNSEDGFKDAEKLDLADIDDNEHQIASNYVDTLGTASGNDAKHLCGSIDSCVVEAPSQIISDKCLADSVEALIGAYLEFGGCEVALRVMKWLEIDCYSEEEIGKSKSYYSNFSKPLSGLIEPSNYNHRRSLDKLYHREKFDQLEEKIQYNFQDKSHLVQAFTHMSYSHNRYTECYQRLEFLGDALLDFLVTFHLYNNYKNLSPGRLTDLRQALVNNNTFGLLTVKYGFHKYLMCLSPALFSALGQFVQRVENEDETIDVLLKVCLSFLSESQHCITVQFSEILYDNRNYTRETFHTISFAADSLEVK